MVDYSVDDFRTIPVSLDSMDETTWFDPPCSRESVRIFSFPVPRPTPFFTSHIQLYTLNYSALPKQGRRSIQYSPQCLRFELHWGAKHCYRLDFINLTVPCLQRQTA